MRKHNGDDLQLCKTCGVYKNLFEIIIAKRINYFRDFSSRYNELTKRPGVSLLNRLRAASGVVR